VAGTFARKSASRAVSRTAWLPMRPRSVTNAAQASRRSPGRIARTPTRARYHGPQDVSALRDGVGGAGRASAWARRARWRSGRALRAERAVEAVEDELEAERELVAIRV